MTKVVNANSTRIVAEGLRALASRSETCSSLSDIPVPTLIICGREDKVTPLEQSEYMHRLTDRSALKVIDRAGHIANLDQPEVFNQHIREFMTKMTGFKEEHTQLQEESMF
jgi:3-oxoadipate enol-lactonase